MTNSSENVRPAPGAYEDLARMADFAIVAPDRSEEQVAEACSLARKLGVGRLTARPADLDLAAKRLEGSGVALGAVISYPQGGDTTSAKLYALRDALERGARSIETVLSPGKMISRQFRYLEAELQQMAQECRRRQAQLIVDLEMGWLAEDLRVIACRIAKRAEVDWVRSGSLFGPSVGAMEDVRFLAAKLGTSVKVDAGSGVRTFDDALNAYEAGAEGFQTVAPEPLLEAWTVEIRRRAAESVAKPG